MVRSGAKPDKVLEEGEYVDKESEYRIDYEMARGNTGAAVYRAVSSGGEGVAVKYPVPEEEVRALKLISERAVMASGVVHMFASGTCRGCHYVVMPLLGTSMGRLFERFLSVPSVERWEIVRAIGRLLLWSLERIHACGIVHCDVQPNNILIGREAGHKRAPFRPFFTDFGCSRPFPGGRVMEATWGSLDFNSIRSASGGEREPFDDLECLGWVLCHAFAGELPWFPHTVDAWERGRWKRDAVAAALQKVREAKLQVRAKGWDSFGTEWKNVHDMPPALDKFLRTCWRKVGESLPDYVEMAQLLEMRSGQDVLEAEEEDLTFFSEEVVPLLDLADLSLM